MLVKDQATALRKLKNVENETIVPVANESKQKRCTSIVVTSGKGGVGKTQFSANLAICLSKFGKKTILFDADMGLANIDIVLGIHPKHNLIHVLEGMCKMKDIVVDGPMGVQIIPASSGIERLANIDTAELKQIIHQLHTLEANTDFLIIDTGAGISRSVIQFAVSSDKTIVVTTPEPASFTDAYATIKSIFKHNPNAKIELIVNFCRGNGEGEEIYNRMKTLILKFLNKKINFLGELPYEKTFSRYARGQKIITLSSPSAKYSRFVSSIGRKIIGAPNIQEKAGLGYFYKLMSFIDKKGMI